MGKPFGQYRAVALWFALAAALARIVLAGGLMPVLSENGFALVVCRGLTQTAPDSGNDAPVDRTHDPCPFAFNGVSSAAVPQFHPPKPRWIAERRTTPVPNDPPRAVVLSTFRPRAPPAVSIPS
ncbi:hypothetical protein [Rhodomicrobium lacus]|uniref:hypothetical protein n=1 Tax=Rhodomicrobium lacus TaxID=2498452 RepID=UPI000F8CF665|nr:hypothetical protein [Rhodomicrobium lacus]